jgi:Tol biopolymer transport system component
MNPKTRLLVVALAMTVGGLLFSEPVQQETASGLFEKAVYLEEAKGDLQQALEVYDLILEKFAENQQIAAKALYRIGLCHEKLGSQEARKAYQRLIADYPGQKEEVALARARLAELTATVQTASRKPTFRKIRIPTQISGYMSLSPDGQKISLSSPSLGKLWITPISGKLGPDFPGEPVELETADVSVEWSAHTWSRDGKWIAFNDDPSQKPGEERKKGIQGIYVVSSLGGTPKKIYENYRDARVINYRMSLSPDAMSLAFSSVDQESKEQHIYSIPVDGGTPRLLTDVQAREPVYSPDGTMIAFVEDKDMGGAGGSLWIVPAQGGTPKLVAEAGMASSPVWSPEGDMIAFVDKRDKTAQLHIIPVGRDGRPAGEKIAIGAPEGIQDVDYLAGWTLDNKIGTVLSKRIEFGLYTVPAEGGRATEVVHGGYPVLPRFSPNGKRIFHFNNTDDPNGGWQGLAIAVVPAEGGPVKVLPIETEEKMTIPGWGGGNRVSPDGNSIVFSGKTPKDQGLHFHIWTLPVGGGKPERLTESPADCTDMFPCWSPDGNNVAFVRTKESKNYAEGFSETNIYIVDRTGGEPRRLTSEAAQVAPCPIAWSPDGKLLAYYSMFENMFEPVIRGGTINVIPVNGGEPRVIGKVQGIQVNKELAWSPDSKRIAFNAQDYRGRESGKDIQIMSLDDGKIVDVKTSLVDTNVYHLDWSPDGKKLVFGGFKGGDREFWLMEDFLHLLKK